MSRTTVLYKAKTKAYITYITHDDIASQRKSVFNITGNPLTVVKFTFQSVFRNTRQNPRHASARGREESLELYSVLILLTDIKTKGFTLRKSLCRSGSQTLLFGRSTRIEATTGNTSVSVGYNAT